MQHNVGKDTDLTSPETLYNTLFPMILAHNFPSTRVQMLPPCLQGVCTHAYQSTAVLLEGLALALG